MIKFQNKNSYKIYNTLLFIVAAILILSVMPKGVKFPYEYKKGMPWLHSTLVSPMNFPIYKSDEDLKNETDSIQKNFVLYFTFENQTIIDHLTLFRKKFEVKWNEHLKKYFLIDTEAQQNGVNKNVEKLNILKNDYLNYCSNLIEETYNKGIIVLPKTIKSDSLAKKTIYVIKNNIAEEYKINDFLDIQTAYNLIDKATNNRKEHNYYNEAFNTGFLEELKIKEFIAPNIFYDEETTKKVITNLTENISLTRGMIGEGEKIISKGEIIDHIKFNILNSLKKEYETFTTSNKNYYYIFIGQFLLIMISLFSVFMFIHTFRNDVLHDSIKTAFILLLIVLLITIVSFFLKYNIVNLYVIPLAILPIILRTFYGTRLALFVHTITILTISFFVPNGYEFSLLQILAGAAALFSLTSVQRRGQLFLTAIMIIITYCVLFFAISIIQEGDIAKINYKTFAWFAANGLLVLASYPLIYIFEKAFGFLSDVTLLELADPNSKVMRMLAEKAPGTFQHALQVSNLVEEVMVKIGGNALLARTGALYHDIGKIDIPQFFIENQGVGKNPHDELDFDKSAEMIISHVKAGVKIAEQNNIPSQIIDFIKTHHGNTKVQYFYRSFLKKYPDRDIETAKFTYTGPIPISKETAVVMICDSVEAASRSLRTITEGSLNNLINTIINDIIANNQLINSDITFKDIASIREILFQQLKNIYHSRIEYPRYEEMTIM